jgi:hypothetical protein
MGGNARIGRYDPSGSGRMRDPAKPGSRRDELPNPFSALPARNAATVRCAPAILPTGQSGFLPMASRGCEAFNRDDGQEVQRREDP